MKYLCLLLTTLVCFTFGFAQTKPQYLQASANGRYLQWSEDKPFFINACSALSLTTSYSDQEVKEYLDNRVASKFNTIQLCAVFAEMVKTIADSAFQNQDLLKPELRFWNHVDWVVKQATDRGLVVMINPIWKQSLSELLKANGPDKCRKFGERFAQRYKSNPKVIYFLGGNEAPDPVRAELDEMGKGIQNVYEGKAILAYLSEPDQSGMEAFSQSSWITLNMTHAYSSSGGKRYPYSINYDNRGSFPKVPVLLAKGYYDFGDAKTYLENGIVDRWGNRHVIRRQAWWNFLSGGIGNVYGAEGICYRNSGGQTWMHCTNYGSSKDMAILKLLVDKIKWWKLQPDVNHQLLVGGFGTYLNDDYAVCSVSENKAQAIIYTPVSQSLELRLPDFGQHCRLRWFDPVTGKYSPIDMRFPKKKKKSVIISTPGINHSGSNDWVLIIEGSRLIQQ